MMNKRAAIANHESVTVDRLANHWLAHVDNHGWMMQMFCNWNALDCRCIARAAVVSCGIDDAAQRVCSSAIGLESSMELLQVKVGCNHARQWLAKLLCITTWVDC